jgi:hypothetical protein
VLNAFECQESGKGQMDDKIYKKKKKKEEEKKKVCVKFGPSI